MWPRKGEEDDYLIFWYQIYLDEMVYSCALTYLPCMPHEEERRWTVEDSQLLHTPTEVWRNPSCQPHRRRTVECYRRCCEHPPMKVAWIICQWFDTTSTAKSLTKLGFSVNTLRPSDLRASVQQQSDALGLALYTRLMQRGDGVHGNNVNRSTCFDQLLQLESSALRSSLVHCWPVRPESKAMSCKTGDAKQNEP